MPERLEWLDALKGTAIAAVVIDHIIFMCQDNPPFGLSRYLFYYSVPLFVLLGGITSSISLNRHGMFRANEFKHRMKNLLLPYFAATLVYSIYLDRSLNVPVFLTRLLHFNASPPFYFVLFYVQLIAVAPFLLWIFQHCRNSWPKSLAVLALLALLGELFTRCTLIDPESIGGGRHLFGGTFLAVFSGGIFFWVWREKLEKPWVPLLLGIGGLALSMVLSKYKSYMFLGRGNPSGLFYVANAVTVFGLIRFLYPLVHKKIWRPLEIIGRYSLWIFLYHWLALLIYSRIFVRTTEIWWPAGAFLFALGGPVIGILVYTRATTRIKRV